MRVRLLFFVLLFAMLGLPVQSHADKVKTNQSAKLYARPGERAKVLLNIKTGQAMTVLAKEDRWLKVRVSGRTGYVPRSKVDMPTADQISRNTRRRAFVDGRGTKRGFGGQEAPDDRVGADALGEGQEDAEDDSSADDDGDDDAGKGKGKGKDTPDEDEDDEDDEDDDEVVDATIIDDDDSGDGGEEIVDDRLVARVSGKTTIFSEADDESDEAFIAKSDTLLYPTGETQGKYTEVENEEGDLGYVLTSKLEIEEPDTGGPRSRQINARARLGVTFVSQGLRRPGVATKGPPNNYNVATSAATVALGGALYYPYKKRYLVGGDLGYDLAVAVPGIKAPMDQTTRITFHNLNVRGVFGYDLKRKSGMMVFARLGLHYQSYQVSDVTNLAKNTATLPSEIVISPMVGAALTLPRLTDKIGLRFSLDTLLVGASVSQTKNLEDGQNPSFKGAIVGVGFTYRWKKEMDIQATYDLNYASLKFGAPVASSQRPHTGMSATRTDLIHMVTVGIGKAF